MLALAADSLVIFNGRNESDGLDGRTPPMEKVLPGTVTRDGGWLFLAFD
jgi:hypothetical protein